MEQQLVRAVRLAPVLRPEPDQDNASFAQLRGHRSNAIVLDGRQIVVGRAKYSNAGGLFWAAGSNTLATRLTP